VPFESPGHFKAVVEEAGAFGWASNENVAEFGIISSV
jgi:hypothetical protein